MIAIGDIDELYKFADRLKVIVTTYDSAEPKKRKKAEQQTSALPKNA